MSKSKQRRFQHNVNCRCWNCRYPDYNGCRCWVCRFIWECIHQLAFKKPTHFEGGLRN